MELGARERWVVTTEELLAFGLSAAAIDRRRGTLLTPLYRGVYPVQFDVTRSDAVHVQASIFARLRYFVTFGTMMTAERSAMIVTTIMISMRVKPLSVAASVRTRLIAARVLSRIFMFFSCNVSFMYGTTRGGLLPDRSFRITASACSSGLSAI